MIEHLIRTVSKVPHLGPLLRTWHGWVIAIVVVSQLFLPVHYYLARDPHDERFAWRMFSPMRMTTCAPPEFKVEGKPVDLAAEFHEAWIEIAKRGRYVVVEAMGARLCRKHPGSAVTVLLKCQYIDRKPITYGGFNLCDAPEL